ncbi:MAG: hypothetical protein KDG52_18530 [Rhodocyclaceae bacterium]|nr:hypothetical protein [Rhodocyclaceae bacterium]
MPGVGNRLQPRRILVVVLPDLAIGGPLAILAQPWRDRRRGRFRGHLLDQNRSEHGRGAEAMACPMRAGLREVFGTSR